MAINGIIYDVSSSDAYKPGGGYAVFSGHDITLSLAKMDMSG